MHLDDYAHTHAFGVHRDGYHDCLRLTKGDRRRSSISLPSHPMHDYVAIRQAAFLFESTGSKIHLALGRAVRRIAFSEPSDFISTVWHKKQKQKRKTQHLV